MHVTYYSNVLSEVSASRGNVNVLYPQQQKSSIKISRSTDYRSQRMIKCPEICHFHSLAEYYFAALLEGDRLVDTYVPQPFRLRLGRKPYIPDIYYVREQQSYVGELKPRGEFDETFRVALTEFFRSHDMIFVVIDNESINAHSKEAQNWITIVRWLLTYPERDVHQARQEILQLLFVNVEVTYGEIIDLGDRTASLNRECAVHQMLHSGEIMADLDTQFFGMNTVLRTCS
jgi:hypothetical protein